MARVLTWTRQWGLSLATATLSLAFAVHPLAAGSTPGDTPPWEAWAAKPDFGLEDIYKALHQAWRGPGHMIPSREMAADYLGREWEGLDHAQEGEALVETLVVGAPFLRLNLRPFKDSGGSADSLLEAFLRSAAMPTDSAAFGRAWRAVGGACGRGELPFSRAAFDSLDGLARPASYPAIHHSVTYASRYRPAYRVLSPADADRLLGTLRSRRRTHY